MTVKNPRSAPAENLPGPAGVHCWQCGRFVEADMWSDDKGAHVGYHCLGCDVRYCSPSPQRPRLEFTVPLPRFTDHAATYRPTP